MPQRHEYEVVINGIVHTMLLTEKTAERRGATPARKARAPGNKLRAPRNKARDAADDRE